MRHRSRSPRGATPASASAPLYSLYTFLLVSVGVLPVSINSSADGAISKHQLEGIRQNRVRFNLDRCDDVCPKRDTREFKINGDPTDLTIATSRRPYHMIVSYVLQIVLRDCFNIDRVVVRPLGPAINQFDQREILAKIRSKEVDLFSHGPETRLPETMINVEVWRDTGYGADYGFSNYHSVHYAGALATQGLFGWWLPRVWIERQPDRDGVPWDHYVILSMEEKTKSFAIPTRELDSTVPNEFSCSVLKDRAFKRRLRDWECDGKVLQSPACKGKTVCATLLAADPFEQIGGGKLGELLSLQIEGVPGGLVNLAFLGSNFNAFVLNRLNVTEAVAKGTLFFSWTPNAMTACDSPGSEVLTLDAPSEAPRKPESRLSCVTRLIFPDCEGNPKNFPVSNNRTCNFQGNEIIKAAWPGLKKSYPEVLRLLAKMTFGAESVGELFRRYLPQLRYYREMNEMYKDVDEELERSGWFLSDVFGQVEDEGPLKRSTDAETRRRRKTGVTMDQIAAYKVACDFLRRDATWKADWGITPRNINENGKKLITLGGMYPIISHWSQPGIKVGVDLAIDMINNDSTILKEYKLEQVVRDSKCQAGSTIKAFIDFITMEDKTIAGIIGPGCSASAKSLGSVTKFFDYAFISYSAESVELSNDFRNNFLRTVPGTNLHADALRSIYLKFEWRQAIFIAEMGDKDYEAYQKNAHRELKDKVRRVPFPDLSLPEVFRVTRKPTQSGGNWAVYDDINRQLELIQMMKTDKTAKLDFRIFSIRADPDMVWRVMCLAYKKGLQWKEGYQWIVPGWFWATDEEWWKLEHPARPRQARLYGQAEIDQLWEEQRKFNGTDKAPTADYVCDDEAIKGALSGSLSIVNGFKDQPSKKIDVPGSVMKDGKSTPMNVSVWDDMYRDLLKERYDDKWEEKESSYASYAYDATWVYAKALEKFLANNQLEAIHTHANTLKFMNLLREVTFNGVSGHLAFKKNTTLDGSSSGSSKSKRDEADEPKKKSGGTQSTGGGNDSSDREDTFVYLQQNFPDERINKVAKYNAKRHGKNEFLELFEDPLNEPGFAKIKWPVKLGQITDKLETPKCDVAPLNIWLGFDAEDDSKCKQTVAFLNVFGGIIGFILIVVIFFTFHKKLKRMKENANRMNGLGILGTGHPCLQLDDWEIPRENIVINRKLGEGAFGMVYGGEAYFEDKGWVSVAIKTLKEGAQLEEKIDFLSEANMMKRFHHRNIVELLGVCTRCERRTDQVYTVMEFMLFNDLKTFLLSRRSLVGSGEGRIGQENQPHEREEVGSRRLTQMALDIANGLAYLNEMDLVHRDLASRNCLLNAEKTVKIGDFGMARQMFDNDYYRFSKKGMLPVRWMAPESIADGLYTPMSDVWSYGIVLYEIITFGSLPYHGISNSQVVEYVKAGNQLCLSEAIPEELRLLLSQCWDFNARERPTIGDIVKILEKNAEMISPYLEAPVASIPVEGAGSLELMAIPWAADRAAQLQPQGGTAQQQQQQQQHHQQQHQQLGYPHNGTHGGADGAHKRTKTTKSVSSFTDGHHQHQPRSPLGRNFSHPSTTSTTTTSQDHGFMEAPISLESQHPKLSLEKSGRFFLRSNSEEVSDSNSPPPTPTAQITSFFNSAVNSAAQALRKQPSKANSLGFSSTPSPSASGLTTPMTLTPTKHPVYPHQQQQQQQHQQQFLHHPTGGDDSGGGDFCASPPDLFPLRPLGNSRGLDGVTSPQSAGVVGGFSKPQLMTSPSATTASYSQTDPRCNPTSDSNGSSFHPRDSHFAAKNIHPSFYRESAPFGEDDRYISSSVRPFTRPSALPNASSATSSDTPTPNSAPPFAAASPPTTPRDASSTALIDVKAVPLSSTPPTRTNDSAYGSGVGPTGLVANAARKIDSKTEEATTRSRSADGKDDDDDDDDISDVVVHDNDAEFYYGINDDDYDDREGGGHYDPLLLKLAGDEVFVRKKSGEGLFLGSSGDGSDVSPPV